MEKEIENSIDLFASTNGKNLTLFDDTTIIKLNPLVWTTAPKASLKGKFTSVNFLSKYIDSELNEKIIKSLERDDTWKKCVSKFYIALSNNTSELQISKLTEIISIILYFKFWSSIKT